MNITNETTEISMEPVSVEEYVRRHPLEYGLAREAVKDGMESFLESLARHGESTREPADTSFDALLGKSNAGNSLGQHVQTIHQLLLTILTGRIGGHDEPRLRGFRSLMRVHAITSFRTLGTLIFAIKTLAGKEAE